LHNTLALLFCAAGKKGFYAADPADRIIEVDELNNFLDMK
jgi:hypothetical protein